MDIFIHRLTRVGRRWYLILEYLSLLEPAIITTSPKNMKAFITVESPSTNRKPSTN